MELMVVQVLILYKYLVNVFDYVRQEPMTNHNRIYFKKQYFNYLEYNNIKNKTPLKQLKDRQQEKFFLPKMKLIL